jgi:23S rRNA (cytosine1962-C5)-methyltransferase
MTAPRRYQLRKDALAIVERGHPWLFREQLSSAAQVFADGDLLRLVDGANQIVGYGLYAAAGAIAIRIVRRGAARPDAAWLRRQLTAALGKRDALQDTDGVRLVHGESDGLAAITVDRFGDTLVAQSYAAGADAAARFAAIALGRQLASAHVVLRPAHRRTGPRDDVAPRALLGGPPPLAHFTERGLAFTVDVAGGQKSGAYLDLRGLRTAVAAMPLAGARVLNLFAYTGMLGRAAEAAGAAHITQVDASERALAFAAAHHVTDAAKHRFVTADIFDWLPALAPDETYDLVIVDPPAMTSRMAQVPTVLAGYKRLYKAALPHVAPGGALVVACCTGRVTRAQFDRTAHDVLARELAKEAELPPEPDHPVGFPQADYLKIAIWRRSR